MKLLRIVAAVLLCASVASAAPAAKSEKKADAPDAKSEKESGPYAKLKEANRKTEIEKTTEAIKEIKKNPRLNSKEKKAQLEKKNEYLGKLKSGWSPDILLDEAMKVGSVGMLPACHVVQVASKDGAIVRVGFLQTARTVVANQVRSAPKVQTKTVWVQMDTSGMVDDSKLEKSGPYKVTGTKKYETATGSATVLLLESTD